MLKLRESIQIKVKRFDEAIKGASSEKVGLKLLRDKRRWLAKNDLFWLCGFTGNDRISKYLHFYQPFCDEVSLMNWQVVKLGIHKPNEDLLDISQVTDEPDEDLKYLQRLYLCFRTLYKTTIITKVHTLQLLLNFPNIHVIICHNIFNNASANLVSIKEMFLNTSIKLLFPECIVRDKDWGNMRGFSLANRTDKGRDEENLTAVGVDTEITGGHWQIAKKNDLVTQDSVNTEEQVKKTLEWNDKFNIGHFDDPQQPLQDYEGTRYHFLDLYSSLKNNAKIKLTEIPLLKNKDDLTSCVLPERFTPEGIMDLKKNAWVFACQMQQTPEDPSKMEFNPLMLVYYDHIPEDFNFYLLVDPASSRKKKADYTVMKVIGAGWMKIDEEFKKVKLIADCVRDKLDPKQRVDTALELAKKWKIKGCGWEAIAFQSTDTFYFEEARRKEKLSFIITEIKSQTISKEDRIRSLLPEYANHEWLWPAKGKLVKFRKFTGRNYDVTEELELEFLHFPLGEHDDLLDTQTFLKQMNIIYPQREITERKGDTTYQDLEDLLDDLHRNPLQKLRRVQLAV